MKHTYCTHTEERPHTVDGSPYTQSDNFLLTKPNFDLVCASACVPVCTYVSVCVYVCVCVCVSQCDGQYIPLPSLQGIAVLNIPSYAGGTNFWGGTKEDDVSARSRTLAWWLPIEERKETR